MFSPVFKLKETCNFIHGNIQSNTSQSVRQEVSKHDYMEGE